MEADRDKSGAAQVEASGTRTNIRGSTFLLSGRVISLTINFLAQLLTIHYLSKLDYGVFAFSFAIVEYGAVLISFGMSKTVSRFAPMYQERADMGRAFGTVTIAFWVWLVLTIVGALAVGLSYAPLAESLHLDAEARSVFLVLCFLAPLTALDQILDAVLASLGATRAVFFRRYIFRPLTKALTVGLVVLAQAGVYWLAVGHTAAGILGVLIHATLLGVVLHRWGFLKQIRATRIIYPVRELLKYSLPQLGVDINLLLRASIVLVVVQHSRGAGAIAEYMVVLPLARLNRVVIDAFAILYAPTASRFFARGDHEQLDDFYWRTAGWITILSFPLFAITFAFAETLTPFVLGERYASAHPVLAMVSLGFFAHAALGLNGRTLAIEGRIRTVLAVEAIVTLAALLFYVLLIPPHGAWGAGVATLLVFLFYGTAKQIALLALSGTVKSGRRFARVYVSVFGATVGLCALQYWWTPALWIACCAVLVSWLILLTMNRESLNFRETLPELSRIPGLGRLLVGPAN